MQRHYKLRFASELAALRIIVKARILRQICLKYSPDQPRVPAGKPNGGQWIDWNRAHEAMGLFDEANRTKCELQYDSDSFQCSLAASARSRQACREQAQSRFTLCMKDQPVPDLIYYLGYRMIIATRTLTVKTKSGSEASVALRLYLPVAKGNEWDCRYEIDWPEDGWPARTIRSHAVGSDALHAIQLAMQKLGVELHMTSYHRDGNMRWEHWNGYGIALPKDGRDLMRGDDAKFYG